MNLHGNEKCLEGLQKGCRWKVPTEENTGRKRRGAKRQTENYTNIQHTMAGKTRKPERNQHEPKPEKKPGQRTEPDGECRQDIATTATVNHAKDNNRVSGREKNKLAYT